MGLSAESRHECPLLGVNRTLDVRFWSDESGASAAEYVIILAILGSALAFAAILLGGAIATAINDTATCINSDGASCI